MKTIVLLVLFFPLACNIFAQSVGSTNGIFNVSDMGTANYSIPIKMPPGINGLQPNLAINYSSQGGNGIMGIGWSISGLSAISRIGNNIYNDGKVSSVTFTANDKFALDGNRLIPVTSLVPPFPTDPTYHTEVETFKDITSQGTFGNGPLSFTVRDQDGNTFYYGGAGYCVTAAGNTPHTWLIRKVQDLMGNYVSFSYDILNGSAYVTSIAYNQNDGTAETPKSFVRFQYTNISNPSFGYLAGGKIQNEKRLTKILSSQIISGQEKVFASFTMTYEDDFYTHLTKITEKGNELTITPEMLPSTEFTYGTSTSASSEVDVHNIDDGASAFIPLDFNGDGLSDVVRIPIDYNANSNQWNLFKNVGNGFVSVQSGNLPVVNGTDPNQKYEAISSRWKGTTLFDFNGDGFDDMLVRNKINHNMQNFFNIYLSNGTSLNLLTFRVYRPNNSQGNIQSMENIQTFAGDFDGDGKTEIMGIGYSGFKSYLIGEKYLTLSNNPTTNSYNPFEFSAPFDMGTCYNEGWTPPGSNATITCEDNPPEIYVIDYNGDGKSDIMWVKDGYTRIYEMNVTFDANNNPVLGSPLFTLVSTSGYPSVWHDVSTGDFNGDGITDVLTYFGDANVTVGWEIGYGNGSGGFNISQNQPALGGRPGASPSRRPVIIADFNGDGKSDIYTYAPSYYASFWGYTQPQIFYSKGNDNFIVENLASIESKVSPLDNYYCMGDFSGDGSVDFITKPALPLSYTLRLFRFHPYENKHLLSQIKNGLGALTSIKYEPLGFTAAYTQGSSSYAYPYTSRKAPFKVVTRVNTDNAINTSGNNINYTYSGLKLHAQGKGIIGFEKISSFNEATSIKEEKAFALNSLYAYQFLSSVTSSYNNSVFASTAYTYGVYHYGDKRIFPYQVSSQQWSLVTGQIETTTKNYSFYDPGIYGDQGNPASNYNGKPFSITTNKGLGLEISTQVFSFPWRLPSNAAASSGEPYAGQGYINSKPYKVVTTNTRQGEPSYSRTSTFNYNSSFGYLTSTVTDPGTTNAITTSFWYDYYGNPLRKLITATGLPDNDVMMKYDISHRFLTETYNAAFPDIKSTATYNMIGYKLTSTAPDGFKTTYVYDGFGRVQTVSDNNGRSTITTYSWGYSLPGDLISYLGAAYYTTSSLNAGGSILTLYDRLGREMKTKTRDIENKWISTRKTYNVTGQLASVSKPYFDNSTPQYINYTYDEVGRPYQTIAPEGTSTVSYQTFGGLTVSTTDPASRTTKVKTDASGVKVSVTDPDNNILNYTYHSNGNLKNVTDGVNILQTYSYDNYNNMTERWDPNYGTYKYTYNAYGQKLSQTDPKSQTYIYKYDAMGRMFHKTGPDGDYSNVFDNNIGLNCGKMVKQVGPQSAIYYQYGMGDHVSSVTYDDMGTVVNATGDPDFGTLAPHSYTYDNFGRLNSEQFPTGAILRYNYAANNELKTISNNTTGVIYYQKNSENAMRQVTKYTQVGWVGDMTTEKAYDSYNLLTNQTTKLGSNFVRNYSYGFTPTTGNLEYRANDLQGLTEHFTYDNLDRLTQVSGGLSYIGLDYLINGNIKKKSDAGQFQYDQANRLSEITTDQNISHATQTVAYTPFDKVEEIEEDNAYATFVYWPDGQRLGMNMWYNNTGMSTYRFYGPDFEKELSGYFGDRSFTYVRGPEGDVVGIIEIQNEDPANQQFDHFVLTDHLGSFTHVVDMYGNVEEEKSFDAWGRLRDPQTWGAYAANLDAGQPLQVYDRGYTGHEHLAPFGIINMNGRLYDPVMGRMFSPDVNIIGIDNLQGYNRYSYALNNPLKYTDPDGNTPAFANIDIGTKGGFHIGATLGIGYRGILSAQFTLGYNFGSKEFYGSVGGTVAGFTLSGGAGTNSGFSMNGGYDFSPGAGAQVSSLMSSFQHQTDDGVAGIQIAYEQVQNSIGTGEENKSVTTSTNTSNIANGISITQFDVYKDATRGGVTIQVTYKDNNSGYYDFQWLQTVRTNYPLAGDGPVANDGKEDYSPFYYTKEESNRFSNTNGSIFMDQPKRYLSSFVVRWQGELSLVGRDSRGQYQILSTMVYGFQINFGKITLSPIQFVNPSDFQKVSSRQLDLWYLKR